MSQYKMVELGTLIKQAKTVRCGSNDYPVLSMTMHDGLVFQNDKFKKTIASKDRSDYKVVKRNQLVISFPIDEGVLAAQRIVDAGIVSPAYGIWDIDQGSILPEFLEYALRCDRALSYYKANLRGSTARRRNLPTPVLLAYTVPLPDVSEQKFILNVIRKSRQIINNRSKELQKLDELVKARFVEMFGDCVLNTKSWNTKRLGDIAEVGSSKRVFVEDLKEKGIPFYRGTEIGALAEGKTVVPELFISEEHYSELCKATGFPQVGDFLMPSICPDGRIWIVNTSEPFYFKDGRVLWVHAINNSYNPVFLLHTLKDRIMTDYSSIASGTTFAELKIFALKECRIFDVPLELQNQFAAFVHQVDKSKVAVQKSLDEAQLLFDSLMQQYFG